MNSGKLLSVLVSAFKTKVREKKMTQITKSAGALTKISGQ
jgi:hypothetical protein